MKITSILNKVGLELWIYIYIFVAKTNQTLNKDAKQEHPYSKHSRQEE
jgi:hypothetical protein